MWSYVPLFEILHIPPRAGNVPGMLLRSHEASQPATGGEKGLWGWWFFPKTEREEIC